MEYYRLLLCYLLFVIDKNLTLIIQSAVQDLDYENEVHLLYAVITLPEGEGTKALVCFINEAKGTIDKIVPLPTWDPVSLHRNVQNRS